MYKLPTIDKKYAIIICFMLCFVLGLCIEHLYQPREKTLKIYSQALEDYNNKNYSNAYYLFSRIGRYSKLKPAAIYRQAMCAQALEDKKSELFAYDELLKKHRTNHINLDAKYRSAQLLLNSNPQKAKKYFSEILYSAASDEYKTASEYFISKINSTYYPNENIKSEIESGFRQYITKYPDGKFSFEAARSWEEFNPAMDDKDKILVARVFYNNGEYDRSQNILNSINISKCWALLSLVLFKQDRVTEAKNLVLTGVSQYFKDIDKNDYKKAVHLYILSSSNYLQASDDLLLNARGQNKDIIWNYRCKYTQQSVAKSSCYENLYKAFPDGDYAQEAMINALISNIGANNYNKAGIIANNFVMKYPGSKYLPMVMFWVAKINHKFKNSSSNEDYENIINNFPDSYYAYRSYWIINKYKTAAISYKISPKQVVYPYEYPENSLIYYLLLLNDYDMVEKFTEDEFIKSWVEYQKGNYSKSIHIAQKAMEELNTKPDKSDLRWRLIYPLNYYSQIESINANNTLLLLSIVKEESFFNPDAKSDVGALGLMQLMPQTAQEVCGQEFYSDELLNPVFNIKIGNLYYESLKKSLNNDILSVASYNGGIGSVTRWLESLNYSDTDEFVEQIPYEETQNYIKKVFKSYWNYLRIYAK